MLILIIVECLRHVMDGTKGPCVRGGGEEGWMDSPTVVKRPSGLSERSLAMNSEARSTAPSVPCVEVLEYGLRMQDVFSCKLNT